MILFSSITMVEAGSYVWASYVVTWVFLAGYTFSLWIRRPQDGGEPK